MATFTATAGTSNMSLLAPWFWEGVDPQLQLDIRSITISADQTQADVVFGLGHTLRYWGSGFTSDGIVPTAGAYTSIDIIEAGNVTGKLTEVPSAPFALLDDLISGPHNAWDVLDGRDILRGNTGHDELYSGYSTNDVFYGGGGSFDSFHVTLPAMSGTASPTFEFHGTAGTRDYIYFENGFEVASGQGPATIDLRNCVFENVEEISFGGTQFVLLNASQFGNGKISSDAMFIWQNNNPTLTIFKDTTGTLDLNALEAPIVDGSRPPGKLRVQGSALDDTIIGTNSALNDDLRGNGGNDELRGVAGNDLLFGGSGDDRMSGGAGNDRLWGEAGNDWMDGGDGNDDFTGGDGNDKLFGGALSDSLYGDAGNDLLDGGTGSDILNGGSGSDFYIVDDKYDRVIELTADIPAGGRDRIYASLSFELPKNVEELVLNGAGAFDGTGNTAANLISGNTSANNLYGLDGNDRLFGNGGADKLYGGGGDDTYIVDAMTQVFETDANVATGGLDRVLSNVTWTLGTNLEDLTLSGAENYRTATGNALNNIITGGAGADTLKGLAGNDRLVGNDGSDTLDGGAGSDVMIGGAGGDMYYVDSTADRVVEQAATGSADTIISTVDYVLGANIESLVITGAAKQGTGNDLGNSIAGNAGHNVLIGNGGNDSLLGGAGNDRLEGGAGNDTLDGGTGRDLFIGGTGSDTFIFNDTPATAAIDTILDFVHGIDKIEVGPRSYLNLGDAAFTAANFYAGVRAHDGDDRIIYNNATGALYYDADGSGASAAHQIAVLTNKPTLSASDFVVILI